MYLSTIYILWLRQLKRYSRSRARMLGSLAQPVLFLVALGFGLGPVFEKAGQGSYLQYIAPGVIAMSILFTSIFSGIEIIWDRQFGFLKETLVAPVPRWAIMFGRTAGGATVAVFQGLIVFCITLIVGFRPDSIAMLPAALGFMILIALFFTALGTAIACTMEDMQAFPLIINFLVMPLFFLSGALFPLDDLPAAIAVVTRVNPLTYGVDGLHAALSGNGVFGYGIDVAVMALAGAVMLWIGTMLFKRIQI